MPECGPGFIWKEQVGQCVPIPGWVEAEPPKKEVLPVLPVDVVNPYTNPYPEGSYDWSQWNLESGDYSLDLQPVESFIGMPPSNVSPQYSPWMQDFFSAEGSLPSLYQGVPSYGGANITPTDLFESWGLDAQGLPIPKEGAGVISSYPGFKERYEVLDFMIEGERVREKSETEQFKLDDLLEGIQTTASDSLTVGGVSRELEDQRGIINQGLIDLDKKRELALSAQETELTQSAYDLRADYEKQAASDYLAWLSDYIPPTSSEIFNECHELCMGTPPYHSSDYCDNECQG